MKKLLLSLAVLAAASFGASAETVTFTGWDFPGASDWTSSYAEHVITFNNAVVTFEKANKQSGTITDCPVTKGNNITIAAKAGSALTSVEFKLVQWTTKAQTATLYVSTDGTEFTATETSSDNFTLTAATLPAGTVAAQVRFSSQSNQVGCASIDFTLDGSGSETPVDPVDPEPAVVNTVAETVALAANTKFEIGYDLTVAYAKGSNVFAYTADKEFIQLYGANSYEAGDVIAKGWVGQYSPYNGTPEIKPVGEFPAAASKSEVAFVPAEVAAADVKAELVNHVILVKGVTFAAATPADSKSGNYNGTVGGTNLTFRNSFAVAAQEPGVYNVTAVVQVYNTTVQLYPTAYEFVEAVKPEIAKVANLKEAFELESGAAVVVDCALTVGFVNGKNILVRDEAGDFIQIYGANTVKVGDVIPAGWEATYTLRYDVPQFAPKEDLPAATEGSFTAEVVAAADVTKAIVNHVVIVKNVVLEAASPAGQENFEGKVGEVTLSFRNNYKLASVPAGTYNIEFWVNLYNGEPSLYVINYEAVGTDGISEIEADAAEAVYYNLQGVEVKNPANGVYIVRRGAKVTKELVR